jgi:hypothetical protein
MATTDASAPKSKGSGDRWIGVTLLSAILVAYLLIGYGIYVLIAMI